ncbi:MAG: tRNA dihydrouridine synthase [Thermoguttaceae bacterium]
MQTSQTSSLLAGGPVIQAALSGYSDLPMRRLARQFGAGVTLCEVLLDKLVVEVSQRKSRLYYGIDDEDHPCGAQLMGSSPASFVAAAERLVNVGFDLIDLNFACPVKKVLGRGRGGHLLRDVSTALDIVAAVRDALPPHIPVTIKLRKGFDDTPTSRDQFFTLLEGAIARGIGGVTLHGRTVVQRYEGVSDWDFVREVKSWLVGCGERGEKIPLVGSGDLFDEETCAVRMRESGVDGIALARGVIGNPWLFERVVARLRGEPIPPPPTLAAQRELIAYHFDLAEKLYGEHRATTTMRAFGVKYAALHPNTPEVRRAFALATSRRDWENVLETWYV